MTGPHPVENLLRGELAKAASEIQKSRMAREFQALGEDRYVLQVPDLGVTLHIDRLRRESGELWGELSVQCDLPGAKVVNGDSISVAAFNMSSARSRIDRAKLIDSRVGVKGIDWHGIVEDFCQRSLDQDRIGRPAIDLRKVEKPCEDAYFDVLGLRMPRAHPSILFGDGGTGKSYIALYIAGKLIENGIFRSVALFDWELSAEDHRERLERLFPDGMPMIHYVSCDRPLVYEVDRLKRIVQGAQIGYAIYDSVAFATNGPPEAAEMASQYFRCVRQIGCGGLHIAHVNKQMDSEKKPFGSAFWWNGARSIWFAKRSEQLSGDEENMEVGLFHRKSNLGKLRPPVGWKLSFQGSITTVRPCPITDASDLMDQLTLRQRMTMLLRRGPLDQQRLCEELDADRETVSRTLRRHKNDFVVLEGGRVGLAAKGVEDM